MYNSYIEKLIHRLNFENLPENGAYDIWFGEIAELLMNNCMIQKGAILYEIIEIEFYLYTPEHPDVIVYPRVVDAGRWFFHQSGVDLTFKSDSERFGGILIRGIREYVRDSQPILGPMKCVNALWDDFDAFDVDSGAYPRLIEKKTSNNKPKSFRRWIPVREEKKDSKIVEWYARIDKYEKNFETYKVAKSIVFDSFYRYISLPLNEIKGYAAKPKQ